MPYAKSRIQEWVAAGLCRTCGSPPAVGRKSCEKCLAVNRAASKRHRPPESDSTRRYYRENRAKVRVEVLRAYGGCCACCGIDHLPYLQLDHKDGGGNAHRRETTKGGGARFMGWAKRNGFPDTLQVLCANCHAAKSYYGGDCRH